MANTPRTARRLAGGGRSGGERDMKPSAASLIVRSVAAVAIGLAEPYVEIAWKCRAGFESSEACVWGKSLFTLGRAAGLVIVAPIAFVALTVVAALWPRR